MTWEDIKREILEACGPLVESRGFKFVKSRTSFEKPTPTGRLMIWFRFVASDVGNYSVSIGCGVRHDAIERIVNQTSTTDKRAQSSTSTISLVWNDGAVMWLNTSEERAAAITKLRAYMQDIALLFLEREYTLQDFSAILNVTDAEGRPNFVGPGNNFWQRALAAAKLARDPRFDDLRRHYTAHVRAFSRAFYFPQFEACMKYIDEHVASTTCDGANHLPAASTTRRTAASKA